MNAATLTHTAADDQDRPAQRETCHQHRDQEADRVFEARLQWFLAVSRAA
jgi:hypothetical protein